MSKFLKQSNILLKSDQTEFKIGDMKMDISNDGEYGWLISSGASIGNDASGATYAGEEYETLYNIIKTKGFGNTGSEEWSSGNIVYTPDFRGVSPIGAGTTDRVAGKDSDGNYYAATLGTYYTDTLQYHAHGLGDIAISSGGAHVHSIDPPSTATGNESATHTHTYSALNTVAGVVGSGSNVYTTTASANTGDNSATHTHTIDIDAFNSASTSHNHANGDFTGNPGAASTDGVHGAPRTGAYTAGARIGITFLIKYK
jgi:hypothetical protein